MKARIFLTITRTGVLKMTKEKPRLTPTQRGVRLLIEVPDSAFEEPPMIDADLNIPASALAHPPAPPVKVEIWEEP